jgi:hypothetical protein
MADGEKKGLSCVPFFHIALHSIGDHGSNTKKRAEIEPLFEKYHVPLVFQGHDHIYYRAKRHGIVYVVTGGGGAPLYELHADRDKRDPNDPEDPNWPDVSASAHHYCICSVYKDHIEITVPAVRFQGPSPLDDFSVPLH